MLRIGLPNGSILPVPPGVRVLDLACDVDRRYHETLVCVTIDGALHDVDAVLTNDSQVVLHTAATPQGRWVLTHTAAHVAAQALKRRFPTAALGIGQVTDAGFQHDLEFDRPFTADELQSLAEEMAHIVSQDLPLQRDTMSKGDLRALLIRRGEVLRLELLEEVDEGALPLYIQGDHIEPCCGPHAPSTGYLGSIRLLGSTVDRWRDDPHAEPVVRLHGTLTPSLFRDGS